MTSTSGESNEEAWVLVSEGGNGESRAAVTAVRALAHAGYRTSVTETNRLSLAGASRWCDRRVPVAPVEVDAAAYANAIRAELSTRPYVTSFFTTDAALLALDAPVRHLLDKASSGELARAAGLQPPPTEVFDTAEELRSAASRLPYPIVVKPALKLSSAEVVENASELASAIGALPGTRARAAEDRGALLRFRRAHVPRTSRGGDAYPVRSALAATLRHGCNCRDAATRPRTRRTRRRAPAWLRRTVSSRFRRALPPRRESADPCDVALGDSGRRQHRRDVLRPPARTSGLRRAGRSRIAVSLGRRRSAQLVVGCPARPPRRRRGAGRARAPTRDRPQLRVVLRSGSQRGARSLPTAQGVRGKDACELVGGAVGRAPPRATRRRDRRAVPTPERSVARPSSGPRSPARWIRMSAT